MLTNTTQYYSEGQGKKVAESVIYKIDKKQIKKKSMKNILEFFQTIN